MCPETPGAGSSLTLAGGARSVQPRCQAASFTLRVKHPPSRPPLAASIHPCARWCFLASPEDFEETLFTAVDAGHDADTVAAMACTLSGAYHGYSQLPAKLVADLECHDHLLDLADGLCELNRRLHGLA